jgi:hypothetical protein
VRRRIGSVNGALDHDSDVQALSTVGHSRASVDGVGDKAFAMMPDPADNAG